MLSMLCVAVNVVVAVAVAVAVASVVGDAVVVVALGRRSLDVWASGGVLSIAECWNCLLICVVGRRPLVCLLPTALSA